MNILFRVDAGGKTGLGHYFRSMALAKSLAADDHTIAFAHLPSSFWEEVVTTFPDYPLSKNVDEDTLRLIEQHSIQVYYVDSIVEMDEAFVKELKKLGVKIVFYQNISKTKHLCDTFILPSFNYDVHFFDDFQATTQVYKGLDYVIFNEEVYKIPRKTQTRKQVREVGLFSGGSDPQNVLLKCCSLINHDAFPGINFTYYYGSDYLFKDQIPVLNDNSSQIKFQPYQTEQLSKMDLLIGAFGVSTYEYMYIGIPILSVGHQSSNALASARTAERTEAILDLGVVDNLTSSQLNQAVSYLVKNTRKRELLVQNALKSIDSMGLERVKNIVLS